MPTTKTFTESPGQTLYAFPSNGNAAQWTTLRRLCSPFGNGRYTVELDESIDPTWYVYVGADVPEDFSDDIGFFLLDMPTTGAGARTITVTVTDGTDPIASALVRLTSGAINYLGTTNLSGIVVFNVDDANWTVAATKGGYSFPGTTIAVNGDDELLIEMTAISLAPPPIANTCAVIVPAIRSSTPVPGADVTATLPDRFSDLPAGVQMVAVDSAVTDSEGIAVLYLPWSSLYVHGDGNYQIRVRDPITNEIVYDRTVSVPNILTARIDQLLNAEVFSRA